MLPRLASASRTLPTPCCLTLQPLHAHAREGHQLAKATSSQVVIVRSHVCARRATLAVRAFTPHATTPRSRALSTYIVAVRSHAVRASSARCMPIVSLVLHMLCTLFRTLCRVPFHVLRRVRCLVRHTQTLLNCEREIDLDISYNCFCV
jgi:hypothetical protein